MQRRQILVPVRKEQGVTDIEEDRFQWLTHRLVLKVSSVPLHICAWPSTPMRSTLTLGPETGNICVPPGVDLATRPMVYS
jgi:hypothetical protein